MQDKELEEAKRKRLLKLKNSSYCQKCGGQIRVIEFQTEHPAVFLDCMCQEEKS